LGEVTSGEQLRHAVVLAAPVSNNLAYGCAFWLLGP
jgi:hypothetical protein